MKKIQFVSEKQMNEYCMPTQYGKAVRNTGDRIFENLLERKDEMSPVLFTENGIELFCGLPYDYKAMHLVMAYLARKAAHNGLCLLVIPIIDDSDLNPERITICDYEIRLIDA